MTDASSQWASGRGAFGHDGASAERMRYSRPMSCALLMFTPGGAPPHDELALPEADEVRQVRVASPELEQLGLPFEAFDARAEPCSQRGRVEPLPRADRRRLIGVLGHRPRSLPR